MMKAFHHPQGSQQAFSARAGPPVQPGPLPVSRQARRQCGVEVEGGKVPTQDWCSSPFSSLELSMTVTHSPLIRWYVGKSSLETSCFERKTRLALESWFPFYGVIEQNPEGVTGGEVPGWNRLVY